jgi:hypothetical protein
LDVRLVMVVRVLVLLLVRVCRKGVGRSIGESKGGSLEAKSVISK